MCLISTVFHFLSVTLGPLLVVYFVLTKSVERGVFGEVLMLRIIFGQSLLRSEMSRTRTSVFKSI